MSRLKNSKGLFAVACLIACLTAGATGFRMAEPVWPAGSERTMNDFVGFKARFDGSDRGICELVIAAASAYRVRLNGVFAGYGPARGPKGEHRVDRWPLAVTNGPNELHVEVAGYNVNSYYLLDQPSFLQAEVVSDGKVVVATGEKGEFTSDYLPRVRKCSRYSFQRPFNEAYVVPGRRILAKLARQEPKRLLPRGVPVPDFHVRSAKPLSFARVRIDAEKKTVMDRCVTGIGSKYKGFAQGDLEFNAWDFMQRLAYSDRTPWQGSSGTDYRLADGESLMFSFGGSESGFPGLKVRCLKPGRLVLTFDEFLKDGELDPLRFQVCNCVVWEIEEPGTYELETFEPYCLGFLNVSVFGGEMSVGEPSVRTYKNPIADRAQFCCSDESLNRIFEAARESYAQNAAEIFTDCPSRERAGWLCDSYFIAPAAQLLTGDLSTERTFLENFIRADPDPALPRAMIPMCYPADHPNGNFIPQWAMWFVLHLDDYARRGGDPALVKAAEPKVRALIDFFNGFRDADGLLSRLPGWNFVEWSWANQLVKKGRNFPTAMLFAQTLDAVARLYGRTDCAEEARAIRAAVRRLGSDGIWFCDDGTGHTEICQYYAFWTKTATPETYPELWRVLVNEFGPFEPMARPEILRQDNPFGTRRHPDVPVANAFMGYYLRLELLSRAGLRIRELEEIKGMFAKMAEKTGSLWEHDNEGASGCHAFASQVAVLLMRDALGLAEIDYRKKTVRCAVDTALPLDFCKGRIPTEDGFISFEWRRDGNDLHRTLHLPDGWRELRPESKTSPTDFVDPNETDNRLNNDNITFRRRKIQAELSKTVAKMTF